MHKLLERYFELKGWDTESTCTCYKEKKTHIFTKPYESESDSAEKIIMNPI